MQLRTSAGAREWGRVMRIRECRFCRNAKLRVALIKYGVRHYAHAECLLRSPGGFDRIHDLPSVEATKLPIALFQWVDGVDLKTSLARVEAIVEFARKRERARGCKTCHGMGTVPYNTGAQPCPTCQDDEDDHDELKCPSAGDGPCPGCK